MEATLQAIVALMLEKGGLWAALVIIMGLAIWRLFTLLMASLEKRIADKDATTVKAIEAINENARALERLTDVLNAGRRRS